MRDVILSIYDICSFLKVSILITNLYVAFMWKVDFNVKTVDLF
jgi:hypothetical protein